MKPRRKRLGRRRPFGETLERRFVLNGSLIISEFMAINDGTIMDEDGDYEDWIELQNTSASPMDITGFYLTDNDSDLTKWQFPNQTIAPNDFLVVFASNKDRAIPGNELHTNFRLSGNGEYLAVVAADGTTVIQEFSPEYPEQLEDVSFGSDGTSLVGDTLVGAGASARVFVPPDNSLGTSWTTQAFNDASWIAGGVEVGFDADNNAVTEQYALLDFGLTGQRIEPTAQAITSGSGNFPATPYVSDTSDTFTVAIDNRDTGGANVGSVDWRDRGNGSNDSLVLMGEDLIKNNAGVIRVTLGDLPAGRFDITSYHADACCSQSGTIEVYVTDALGTNVLQGATGNANFTIGNVGNLDTADVEATEATFTVESNGTDDVVLIFDGRPHTDNETPINGLRINQYSGLYDPLITTDVEPDMLNQNASVYVRSSFTAANPAALTSLTLRMQYDDGFIAYLNGAEIASRNAPAVPSYNSAATTSRLDSQALVFEDIDVSAFLPLLNVGQNVLAIHGLNELASDDDLLIIPELIGDAAIVEQVQYYTTPTPGSTNIPGALGIVDDTEFSVDRGFYDTPIQVAITSDTPNAQIRYTLDGTEPTATTGFVYSAPINVTTTTNLRAAAYRPGWISSNVDTHTYIFLDDVLQQDGAGLVTPNWGHSGPDWEVDPDVVNDPQYAPTIRDDFKAVPSLSLTTDFDNFFGTGGQGIYLAGQSSPRGTSIEIIYPDGSKPNLQIDGSVEIQGGSSTNRWKTDKISMELKFRRPYGPTKLDFPLFDDSDVTRFDRLILDATLNLGFLHPSSGQRNQSQYIRDQFMADLQNAMGGYSFHGTWVHLYIDGLYWGMYGLHEKTDASFAAEHLGGDKDDYDILKHRSNGVVSGTSTDYNNMLGLTRADMSVPANFDLVKQNLDVPDFIHYMILNYYGGNTDWSHHNWYASRNRVLPESK